MEDAIRSLLDERVRKGLLRDLAVMDPGKGAFIFSEKKRYNNFSSNDYLGLSKHPEIIKAVTEAISSGYYASGASRLMTGSLSLFNDLEDDISGFKKKPAALVFNSGYHANIGVISSVCSKGDVVFSDRLDHASIVDGIRLSGARSFRFRHNDMAHLEELLLRERKKFKKALIVTETVFSMDGDIAPIDDIIALKERFGCMLMADEAHATGVLGTYGEGLVSGESRVEGVDIIMGTFSKALGSFGAYVAVSKAMREYLINFSRSFIYSTSLPIPIISANICSLKLVRDEGWRREKLFDNVRYLRGKLLDIGVDAPGETQIIPVVVGSTEKALQISRDLRERGYWVTPVRPPTVPEGTSRIRLSVSSDHDKEMINGLIDAMKELIREA